jgi:hypothetical protein
VINILTWRLKARIVKRIKADIGRQRLVKHAPAATGTHATIEEQFEVMFSMRSVPRLYSEAEWEMYADRLKAPRVVRQ